MSTASQTIKNRHTAVTELPQPAWLDPSVYPFKHHYMSLEEHTIHYIDEGNGPILLFLHANPLWSFQYRHIITPLRKHFRCIALDYPGFGLSVARPNFTNTLQGNSRLVERFIETLGLQDITLVCHDSGVSIGLGVVIRHRDWFRALIISNGFAWPLTEDPSINGFIKVVASPFFRAMIVNFNFLLRYTVMNLKISKLEKRAYLMPFAQKQVRRHQHDLFRSIIKSHDYLLDLKNHLPDLRDLPVLLDFADNDPTYKAGWLQRYEGIFPNHTSVKIEGSHHFPQEYNPAAMTNAIEQWWAKTQA